MKMHDPRSEITHQIRAGQVYTDARTDEPLTLVYMDDDHAVLKDEAKHARLTKRSEFETEVGAGRYKVSGNVEPIGETAYTTIDFKTVAGVGDTTARSLQASGYTTTEDVQRATDKELLALRGVGEGNLANIRKHAQELQESAE